MNNLWEPSLVSANCDICPGDEPFVMPLERSDFVALRFEHLWTWIQDNSNGIPIGANVALSIVNNNDTVTLCNLSTANLGRFVFGYYISTGDKVAQYQIYAPVPFEDETGLSLSHYYFNANHGQQVKITGGPGINDCNFIMGVDPLPPFFVQVQANRYIVPASPLNVNTLNVLQINGTPTTMNAVYTTATACDFEGYQCFRYKLSVTYSAASVTRVFYTKPFRVLRCGESVRLRCTYPQGTVDCLGWQHSVTWNPINIKDGDMHLLRIPADVEREANRVRKSFNSKCYAFKTEVQRRYRLKSDPVPWWFAEEVENVIAGQNLTIDNVPYLNEDTDAVFQNNDVESSSYQFIDLPLTQCKCEKVFVC